MPPKRKAESQGSTSKAKAARTTGPTSSAEEPNTTTTEARATRSTGTTTLSTSSKPNLKVYGKKGKRVTRTITVPDTDEEESAEKVVVEEEEVKAGPGGRETRGRGKAIAEPDAASTSSKENAPKSKKAAARSRTKAAPVEAEETVPDSEEEVVDALVKPPKQRKTTTTKTPPVNPPSSAPATRPTRARGRPPKTQVPAPAPAQEDGQVEAPAPLTRQTRSRNVPTAEPAQPVPRTSRRKGQAKAKSPPPEPTEPEEQAEEEDLHRSPSPPRTRRNTRNTKGTAAPKRPRSPSPKPARRPTKNQQSPKKPKVPSPLFSDVESEEEDELPQVEALPPPPSPSKKRKVVVEIPQTPKRKPRAPSPEIPLPTVTQDEEEDEEAEEPAELPPSPSKEKVYPTTPSRHHHVGFQPVPSSPTKTGGTTSALPEHLMPCLNCQKRAVLRALANPPAGVGPPAYAPEVKAKGKGKAKEVAPEVDEEYDNAIAYGQLKDLLDGTVVRNEGNSCLLLGPRSSGKTRLFERCISELTQSTSNPKPIVIRLSGWVQSNDRLALRQIAIQLAEQTGGNYLSQIEGEESQAVQDTMNDDDNPFLDSGPADPGATISLPPASHLPALISLLPTLNRPTIVLVDGFDLFSLHARQALLYCLLDTAQACQSSMGNKGIAVVGLTSRVDVINLFEKRVKSRFSGRIFRVGNVAQEEGWFSIMRKCLLPRDGIADDNNEVTEEVVSEWSDLWSAKIQSFLEDSTTKQVVRETYGVVRDLRVLTRILTSAIARLSPHQPFPTPSMLSKAAETQRARTPFTNLHNFSYPALSLLIASYHSDMKGHPVFNFEMLYDAFQAQVRASAAAPVQLHGSAISMPKLPREVMFAAFENLVATRVFVATAAHSSTTPKEFVKYRCVVERDELKKGIEKTGNTNLKKWLTKA